MRSFSAASPTRDHPALAGRQLLVGVEAEGRRMAARADAHAVAVDGAERLAGVLDDRQPHALEGGQVGRVAEDVHGQQRASCGRSPRPPRPRGIEVQRRARRCRRRPGARARRATALALATNENGRGDDLVARRARRPRAAPGAGPAVPLDTAHACAAPSHAANACSKAGTRGPSESWPERSTSMTAASSSGPRTGWASGMTSVVVSLTPRPSAPPARRARRCAPAARRRPASRRAPPTRRR